MNRSPPPTAPRIIAGRFKGLRLEVAAGRVTRPTRAMVREALFGMLGARVEGACVLDLYAGSGALGIEALSRGAAAATFVERDPRALAALRANLAAAGLQVPEATVLVADVMRFAPPPAGFDLVLADPPFADLHPVPPSLAAPGVLAAHACLAIETPVARLSPQRLLDLSMLRRREYGTSAVCVYGRSDPG